MLNRRWNGIYNSIHSILIPVHQIFDFFDAQASLKEGNKGLICDDIF